MAKETIGKRIKTFRKERGLTQAQLARDLGYSHKSVVTHIEKGESEMSYEKILLLLRTYAADANELFDVQRIDELLEEHEEYSADNQIRYLAKYFCKDTPVLIKKDITIKYQNMPIYFRYINNESDLIYALFECELYPEQKELVNPPAFSIGRAYLQPNNHLPFVICLKENNQRIGFISLCKWLGKGDAFTWSCFIDKQYQGQGYGKSSADLAIKVLKAIDNKKPIKLATEKENKKAQKLYMSLGFTKTEELDGDDLVFQL